MSLFSRYQRLETTDWLQQALQIVAFSGRLRY